LIIGDCAWAVRALAIWIVQCAHQRGVIQATLSWRAPPIQIAVWNQTYP